MTGRRQLCWRRVAPRLLALLYLALNATGTPAQQDPVEDISLLQGDPARGRLVFAPCRACHATDPAAGHGNGPNLHRIFGKVAGKQAGFEDYSQALAESGFVWTPGVMYAWLENPMAALPGTTMMSAGVPDARARADLIAYLQMVSVRGADAAAPPDGQ